ncbi:MAG: hypothetical protein CMP86_10505 [Gammaproteobacteria bacterium]|nr:hypothetical protein [Gammaproteobacteria bacterium]
MIDALLGALVAVTATTALLAAIQLSESSFDQVGGSFLIEGNQSVVGDLKILNDAGYDSSSGAQDRETLESDLSRLPSQLPE